MIFCSFCSSSTITPPQIRTFNSSLHPEFGDLRTLTIDGEPWFVGKDVAVALGYGTGKSLANAVARHVAVEDKGVTEMMTPGGKQDTTIINESGLYSLILGSKLEKAKEFKHWVTAEVLPTIRKTGGYIKSCFFLLQYHSPLPPLSHFSVKKNFLIKPSEYSEHQKIHYSWLEMSRSGLIIASVQMEVIKWMCS